MKKLIEIQQELLYKIVLSEKGLNLTLALLNTYLKLQYCLIL